MVGQGEKVTVTIRGGGPWGFRLFGGEDLPLTIAKVSLLQPKDFDLYQYLLLFQDKHTLSGGPETKGDHNTLADWLSTRVI